jgi:cell division septal protein FtsQ
MKSGRPILAEDDQRYWRRRANRRVRKVRRTRTVLHWSLVLAVHGGIAGVLLLSAAHVVKGIVRSGEFALDRVEIAGAKRASAETIRRTLEAYRGTNLFQIDLEAIERTVRRDPWVRNATVKRVFPGTLRVTLEERTPVAVALIGGLAHLVGPSGYVIGPSALGFPDDLPVISGLQGLDDAQLRRQLKRGVILLERLNRDAGPFADAISELDLSRKGWVTARTVFPGPRILLDPRRIERNVEEYIRLRREIERRAGTLEYVDLRWRDRIAVMPAVKKGEGR